MVMSSSKKEADDDDDDDELEYRWTLALDSPLSTLAATGGKGHNLSVLSRACATGANGSKVDAAIATTTTTNNTQSRVRIRVPPGFTVTVGAYSAFVRESPGLEADVVAALGKLHAAAAAGEDYQQDVLEEVSEEIRTAFRNHQLPPALRAEIHSRLQDLLLLLPEFEYVAVRSSATCEDLPGASFAGQHDTYLNVKARDDNEDNDDDDDNNVCRHVVDCFASLFTARALAYRERRGIGHLGNATVGMAVVVQAMAASSSHQQSSSGVLFTANPLTGRRTESVLEVVPGLGEALVSGLTEPDRYVVSRLNGGSPKIIDARVGAKRKAIRPLAGGGVAEIEEDVGDADALPVLDDATVLELVELGQRIEQLFAGDDETVQADNPQDIEWARAEDGTIYVVQSRPITTLFPLPQPTPDSTDPLHVFLSFGAIQGFQMPIFPSGQDAFASLFGGMVELASWGRKGRHQGYIQSIAGRIYLNGTRVARNRVGLKLWRKVLPAVEPGILVGLEQVLEDPRLAEDSGLTPFVFFRLASFLSTALPRFVASYLFPDASRERMVSMMQWKVDDVAARAEATTTLREVVDLKDQALRGVFKLGLPLFLPRMAAGMSPLYVLTRLASDIEGGKDLVLTMTRGLPHNVTTEMDLKLWQAAKSIRADPTSLDAFRNRDADALAADFLNGHLPGAAQEAVREFADEYGMRGLYEIDFGRPRWREQPAPLMQTLQSYIEIDDEDAAPDIVFAKGERVAEDAVERLGRELNRPWLVRFLARRIRSVAGLRELPKFTIIRIMGIIRLKMLECGRELVRAGVLEEPSDVFLLHDEELKEIGAAGGTTDWKALIADRKAFIDRESERTRIPRVLTSDGFGFYGGAAVNIDSDNPNVLLGEPVSPGTAEGIVRVVLDPSKTKLLPGEVLVCHGTDPSWTPLFLAAKALVMEVGGLMTHGSVVAREYGIPAVVGLERITDRLVTGQRIRVDGSSGVVEILVDDDEDTEREEDEEEEEEKLN